jgi:glycosyltransferase involved in cell wall biosynthesis
MKRTLSIMLVDEGMNSGGSLSSKIGGGQLARRRFFSSKNLFSVTLFSSEKEVTDLWKNKAEVVYNKNFKTIRPQRTNLPFQFKSFFSIIKEALRASNLLHQELLKHNYDILFLNDNKSRLLFIFGLLKRPKSNYLTAIQVDGEWKFSIFDYFMKVLFLTIFNIIICPSNYIKNELGWAGRFFENKVVVAYPGVKVPEIKALKKDIGKKQKVIFACIGTLRCEIKGQDLIVQAIDLLLKQKVFDAERLEVRFYGNGPDKKLLEKMINDKNLQSVINFYGFETDLEKIYREIDCCIIASRTESASIVLMESLVQNIPAIVADLDAVIEIVSPFYRDLTFKSGDASDLARVIETILTSNIVQYVHEKLKTKNKEEITLEYQVQRVYSFFQKRLKEKAYS